MARIIYIRNPSRSHKLLPLLEGTSVTPVENWHDVISLKRVQDTSTAVIVDNFGRWGAFGVAASALLRAPLAVRLRGEYFREEYERNRSSLGSSSVVTLLG